MNTHKCRHHALWSRRDGASRARDGWSVAAAAAAFEVSTRTVRKWLTRFQTDGLPGLRDRPCRPKLVANKLAAPWIGMIVQLRRDYRMTAQEIGARLHLPRSTVAGHLARLGLDRLAQLEQSEPARRYRMAAFCGVPAVAEHPEKKVPNGWTGGGTGTVVNPSTDLFQ
jgi:transposase